MFCDACGARLEAGYQFCSSCGKPIGAAPSPAGAAAVSQGRDAGRLARHLRILGILWIVISVFRLLAGVAVLAVGVFVFGMLHGAWLFERLVPSVLGMVAAFMLLCAVGGLMAGWGLLERRPWARGFALILGFLSLLDLPFGTALGIYTLVILLPSDADREFHRLASAW